MRLLSSNLSALTSSNPVEFRILLSVPLLIFMLGGISYASFIAYSNKGFLVDPSFAVLYIFLIWSHSTYNNFATQSRLRKQIKKQFEHYLDPGMVGKLQKNPELLKLGGERKDMTFLFCDIRGFTPISETYKDNPEGLVELINEFLTNQTNIILKHGGTIDKYMGDCIMAFWNAPIDVDKHEQVSCEAALSMHKALKELNDIREQEAKSENKDFLELKIGIGLNTGGCVVGNMGSDQRFDYSVLGDAVNLASRLEGQSKGYGVKTVIGQETNDAVKDTFATLQLDMLAVKGKKEAVSIFCLLGDPSFKNSVDFKNLEKKHKNVLDHYFNQNWKDAVEEMTQAKTLCKNLMKDYYEMMTERINEFKKYPPPKDWDGVFVATSK